MVRGGPRDAGVDGDEEIFDPPDEAPRRPARSRAPPYRRARPTSVRAWDPDESASEDDTDEQERWTRGRGSRRKPPVYWRARDSLWFEPLVALAIVVLLLVAFWAYTQNWPPAYVVESNSMQHGTTDVVGLINAGDIVLAQKVPVGSIVSYLTGLQTGYSTYGEYGDVILYYPNGDTSATPIVHRAILYLQWDPTTDGYNATDLLPFQQAGACGTASNAVYATTGTTNECGTAELKAGNELELFHIGWKSINETIYPGRPALGQHSGFLTMGDNNTESDDYDQAGTAAPGISTLVEPGWIIGVARGMIPWFGSVKLLLDGNAGRVPSGSWAFMGLTIAAVIVAAFGIHYVLRREGVESPMRRREEEENSPEVDEEEVSPGAVRRFFGAIRPWRSEEFDPADDEVDSPPPRTRTRPPVERRPPVRGRPRPHVRPRTRRERDDDR
jgi:signal peptidase I